VGKREQQPHKFLVVMYSIKILKIWLGQIVKDFKLNILTKKNIEFGWDLKNPHHWKCNYIIYDQPLKFPNFGKFNCHNISLMVKIVG